MKKYVKKYTLIFILIAFAITMILWPLASKQPIRTIHENPGTAQTGFNISMAIIPDYGDIVSALASGGYGSISELIKELDLDSNDIPADIRFIMQTYNNLLSDLTTNLSNLDTMLDEVELLLVQSEFDETSLKITDVDYLVEDIEYSLEDIDNANEQIKSILGSFAPAELVSVTNELRAGLLEGRGRLEALKEAYEASAPQKIPTGLILEIPEIVYPGRPYIINGQIIYEAETPLVEREIRLLWDGELMDTVYSDQDAFNVEVIPDDNTILGEHILKVIIEAQDQYGSTSDNVTITVIKDLPEIKIDHLSYNILSRKVHVRGKVESETPIQESMVIIARKGTSIGLPISSDGEFDVLLGLPLGLINIGEQEIKIWVKPSETSAVWQFPTEVTADIFVLDVFSVGFISTAFIVIGMIIYVTQRGGLGKGGSGIMEVPASPEPAQEYTDEALQEFEEEALKGTRGQIFKAYTEAMKMVEKVTKVSMEPHTTFREFLKKTTPKLNGVVEAFTELTHLTEDTIYSPHVTGLEDIEKAESLVLAIKGALNHEAV